MFFTSLKRKINEKLHDKEFMQDLLVEVLGDIFLIATAIPLFWFFRKYIM